MVEVQPAWGKRGGVCIAAALCSCNMLRLPGLFNFSEGEWGQHCCLTTSGPAALITSKHMRLKVWCPTPFCSNVLSGSLASRSRDRPCRRDIIPGGECANWWWRQHKWGQHKWGHFKGSSAEGVCKIQHVIIFAMLHTTSAPTAQAGIHIEAAMKQVMRISAPQMPCVSQPHRPAGKIRKKPLT